MKSVQTAQLSLTTEAAAIAFFRESEGNWQSQRRYYTLRQKVDPQEVLSFLTVRFLPQGAPELIQLAQLHQLEDETCLLCGSFVTWESQYRQKSQIPASGSTVFGVFGNILYRDRGFATTDPVKAIYSLTNPKTLCLRTEYGGSVFEEEIKLIGQNYRTRQTIISRAGQEIMIGQYLETRID